MKARLLFGLFGLSLTLDVLLIFMTCMRSWLARYVWNSKIAQNRSSKLMRLKILQRGIFLTCDPVGLTACVGIAIYGWPCTAGNSFEHGQG
jgi:hypothetical protein